VVSDLSDRPEVYKRLRAAAERAVGECLFRKSGNFRFAEGSSEALRRTVSIDATRLLHLAAQRADEDAAGEERPQREVVTTATLGTDLLYVGDTPGRPDLSSIPVLALADSQPVLTEPISGARAMGLLDGGVVESPQYFSVRREPASRRDWALAGVALLTTIAVASGVLWRTNTDRQAVAAMRASVDVRESSSEATGGGVQTAIMASATVGGLETLAHSLGPETSEGDLSANPSRRVTRTASTALARPAESSVVSTVSTRDEGTDSGRSTTFASPPAASPRATRPQSLPTDALQPTFADRPSESFDGGTFLGSGNTVITPLQEVTAPVLVENQIPVRPPDAEPTSERLVVDVRVLVGPDGLPVDVQRSGEDPAPGYADAAIAAAQSTVWNPARGTSGEPTEMWVTVRYRFAPTLPTLSDSAVSDSTTGATAARPFDPELARANAPIDDLP